MSLAYGNWQVTPTGWINLLLFLPLHCEIEEKNVVKQKIFAPLHCTHRLDLQPSEG